MSRETARVFTPHMEQPLQTTTVVRFRVCTLQGSGSAYLLRQCDVSSKATPHQTKWKSTAPSRTCTKQVGFASDRWLFMKVDPALRCHTEDQNYQRHFSQSFELGEYSFQRSDLKLARFSDHGISCISKHSLKGRKSRSLCSICTRGAALMVDRPQCSNLSK